MNANGANEVSAKESSKDSPNQYPSYRQFVLLKEKKNKWDQQFEFIYADNFGVLKLYSIYAGEYHRLNRRFYAMH